MHAGLWPSCPKSRRGGSGALSSRVQEGRFARRCLRAPSLDLYCDIAPQFLNLAPRPDSPERGAPGIPGDEHGTAQTIDHHEPQCAVGPHLRGDVVQKQTARGNATRFPESCEFVHGRLYTVIVVVGPEVFQQVARDQTVGVPYQVRYQASTTIRFHPAEAARNMLPGDRIGIGFQCLEYLEIAQAVIIFIC